jgi:transcriptional regulator with XRE-family HTH domain
MNVGARILATRKEKGLSQQDIACDGVTTAHISRIEHGLREPSVRAIRKIAGKLGVDAVWLETGLRSGTIIARPGDRYSDAQLLKDELGLGGKIVEIRVTELAPDDPRLA